MIDHLILVGVCLLVCGIALLAWCSLAMLPRDYEGER